MATTPIVIVRWMVGTMVGTIVTAVPAIEHTKVATTGRTVVVSTRMVIAVSAYIVPSMSATVAGVEHWTPKEEIVTVRITCIDAKVPISSIPVQRTIEVGGINEILPLPV